MDSKKSRIEKEEKRLKNTFSGIDELRGAATEGLIRRAAFMRVTLEELETDIQKNGVVESFSQGNQAPYERLRPSANAYNSLNTSYQKIIKQLTDLLPKSNAAGDEEDDFDRF